MSDKIPLNDVLNAIDKRDFDWYSHLPEEQKKKWSSWLFIRYASSVFCVEKFGTERMEALTKEEIYDRLEQFKSLTQYEMSLSK